MGTCWVSIDHGDGVLREQVSFASVLDVGCCGRGFRLAVASPMGASRLVGVEGPWTRVEDLYCNPSWVRMCDQAKAQNGGGNPAHASVSSVARQIGGEFASEMETGLGNEQRRRDCGIASDKARWNPTASDETAADDPG
jgi:hypothetical protein